MIIHSVDQAHLIFVLIGVNVFNYIYLSLLMDFLVKPQLLLFPHKNNKSQFCEIKIMILSNAILLPRWWGEGTGMDTTGIDGCVT